jgi:multisubunit Na+/H+ antiporter MnhE subunit
MIYSTFDWKPQNIPKLCVNKELLLAKSVSLKAINSSFNITSTQALSYNNYIIGLICALLVKIATAKVILNKIYKSLPILLINYNAYTLGRIGKHNMVITCLPSSKYSNTLVIVVAI